VQELIEALEEQIKLKEATIKLLEGIVDSQKERLALQHNELAERRFRDHLVDESPWGFAAWMLLKDVFPFSLWYHRHEND